MQLIMYGHILLEKTMNIQRYSDDGEPKGNEIKNKKEDKPPDT